MTPLPPTIREIASAFSNYRIAVIMEIIWDKPLSVKVIQYKYTEITKEQIVHSSISQGLKRLRALKLVNHYQDGREVFYSVDKAKATAIITLLKTIINIQNGIIERD